MISEVTLEQAVDSSRIRVDWSKVEGLPDEVLSTKRKSWYLPYKGDELNAVLDSVSIFTDVPLACKGEECSFASTCPLIKHKTVGRWAKDKLPCPVELLEAFRHFSGYVRHLKIDAEDYTSLQIINDLVRMLIMMRRCDLLIRKEDPLETMVLMTNTNQSNRGVSVESRKPNELLSVQKQLRTDINNSYKYLLASREARLKERQTASKEKGMSDAMTDIVHRAIEEERERNRGKS
jgi:hypothetical protein